MTALWLRVRIWLANRLLDLGMVRTAKAILPPPNPDDRLKGRRE